MIHEADQFVRGIDPREFWMTWVNGSALDLWTVEVPLTLGRPRSHFGHEDATSIATTCSARDAQSPFWFPDPFARETGTGTLSAFTADSQTQSFPWADATFVPPEIDDMVVYEVNVREFNTNFDCLATQLDYVKGLGRERPRADADLERERGGGVGLHAARLFHSRGTPRRAGRVSSAS